MILGISAKYGGKTRRFRKKGIISAKFGFGSSDNRHNTPIDGRFCFEISGISKFYSCCGSEQICAGPVVLNLVVQLAEVIRDGDENRLGEYGFLSSVGVLSEIHVFLFNSERAFDLNGAVDTKLSAVIALNSL